MSNKSLSWVVAINTSSQFLGRLISSATTFVLLMLLARSLGVAGYGDLTKITTFVSFFYLFADFGLNATFLRLKDDDSRLSFTHLFGTRIIFSIILIFINLSLLIFLPSGQTQGYTSLIKLGIILYSVTIFFQALTTSANAVFQHVKRYDLSLLALVGGSIIKLGIILLFATQSYMGGLFCFFLGSLVTTLLSIKFAKKFTKISPNFSFIIMKKLFLGSLPLGLTLVFNLIYFRIDSVILTLTQPTQSVGVYNFAFSLFDFFLVIPIFFMNSIYPYLLDKKRESMLMFFRFTKKAGVILFTSSIFTGVTIWVCAPLIKHLQPEFLGSIMVLRILSFSIPFFFLSSLTMWILITLNKRSALIGVYGFSMLLNIIANTIFTPKIGIISAAWITVVGEAIVLIATLILLIPIIKKEETLKKINP